MKTVLNLIVVSMVTFVFTTKTFANQLEDLKREVTSEITAFEGLVKHRSSQLNRELGLPMMILTETASIGFHLKNLRKSLSRGEYLSLVSRYDRSLAACLSVKTALSTRDTLFPPDTINTMKSLGMTLKRPSEGRDKHDIPDIKPAVEARELLARGFFAEPEEIENVRNFVFVLTSQYPEIKLEGKSSDIENFYQAEVLAKLASNINKLPPYGTISKADLKLIHFAFQPYLVDLYTHALNPNPWTDGFKKIDLNHFFSYASSIQNPFQFLAAAFLLKTNELSLPVEIKNISTPDEMIDFLIKHEGLKKSLSSEDVLGNRSIYLEKVRKRLLLSDRISINGERFVSNILNPYQALVGIIYMHGYLAGYQFTEGDAAPLEWLVNITNPYQAVAAIQKLTIERGFSAGSMGFLSEIHNQEKMRDACGGMMDQLAF